MDELDFEIMGHLVEDGRKSLTDVAKATGVAIGTVRNRVVRLVEKKVLLVYGRVDPNRIGFNAYAHIYISVRPAHLIDTVAEEIAQFPEVSFLALVAGDYDLEVNVMCRNNDHLTSLMTERLQKIEGVYHTKTTMYLKLYKVAQPDLNLVKDQGKPMMTTLF